MSALRPTPISAFQFGTDEPPLSNRKRCVAQDLVLKQEEMNN